MPRSYSLTFEELPHRAAVVGFDHFQATVAGWITLTVVLCAVVVGAFSSDWRIVAALGAAAFIVACAVVQLLRFKLVIERTGIVLERSFLGVVYSRQSCADPEAAEFMVNGTGDWGDDGTWPGSRYCEVMAPGWSDACIGTPKTAETVCMFLANQRARVIGGTA